jgi:hypothetical protein
MVQAALGDLAAIDEQKALPAGAQLSRLVRHEFIAHVRLAGRQGLRRSDGIDLHADQAVGVLQLPILHIQREAAEEAVLGHDDAFGAALGSRSP